MEEDKDRNIALEPGTVIARKYTVRGVLGAGGFGITYVAADDSGRMVALKEYFRSGLCERRGNRMEYSDPVSSEVLRGMKAFVNEGKRLISIAGKHPNIVAVKEIVYDNNTVYIAMELVEGEDFDTHMRKHRSGAPMSEAQAVKAIMPVVEAVAMLHLERITHLDIKPANIVLSGQGPKARPVLIDFGLSKHYDECGIATTVSAMAGCTPGYAPVEQYAGEVSTFTPQSDVYSLGATLFFLLTGTTPPLASSAGSAVINKRLLEAGVGEGLASAVGRAMAMSPDDRPADAGMLAQELGAAVEADAASVGDGHRRTHARGRLVAVMALVAFMAVSAFAAFMWIGADPVHPEEMADAPMASGSAPQPSPSDSLSQGYSLYGEDLYARLEAPGAMINIDRMPLDAEVGDTFAVEIGVKTTEAMDGIDDMAAALQPRLKNSRFDSLSIVTRESGGDMLTILTYRYRAMTPGTEEVPEQSIDIGGATVTHPSHRFEIHE